MRRRNKISIPPKYVLAILASFCIVLIIVSFKYERQLSPVKTTVGGIMTPMQKGINRIGSWIHTKAEIITTMETLIDENKSLKEELASVSYDNKILQQDKFELADLRSLYELDKKYPSYPKVAARVISKGTDNWYNVFTIDKGTDDGLAVDMNVMAGDGLVGIITEIGHNYAKVRSIIDDKSSVSGMFLKTTDTCFVNGNLELIDSGLIEVEMIPKDAKIEDGFEVVTSHISPKFLQGILIGYVSNITVDSSNMTKSGFLTPAVDFHKLDTVLVITELKEKQN